MIDLKYGRARTLGMWMGAAMLLCGAVGCPEDAVEDPCAGVVVGAAPLRRLTHTQYANTITDLFDGQVPGSDAYPQIVVHKSFSNDITLNALDQAAAEGIFTAAEQVATAAAPVLMATFDCDPQTSGDEVCLDHFLDTWGLRIFRRPVAEAQRQPLRALFQQERAIGGFEEALMAVIQAMFTSPQFLYLDETGDAHAKSDNAIPLDGYQLASRLSYLLWNSTPDAELLVLAEVGALIDPATLQQQAKRMLEDPRTRNMVNQFYREWLQLGRLEVTPKDSSAFPNYNEEMRTSLLEHTDRYVEHMYWEQDADLETFLTSRTAFVNAPIAQLYGISTPEDPTQWQEVQLPAEERMGILTQAGFLSAMAHSETSSPIFRGVFLRRSLLCDALENPPASAILQLPEREEGAPIQTQLEQHRSQPGCANCHNDIDPLGLGFENYDAMGQWRTVDNGAPIDASGEVTKTSASDGPYQGALELIGRLASSDDVRQCVARQWLQFSRSRAPQHRDSCDLNQLDQAFLDEDMSLRALLIALTQTNGFRYRPNDR